MTTEIINKETGETLHSNRPMDKRDLKRAGAFQIHVGGSWYGYNAAITSLEGMGYKFNQPVRVSGRWQDDLATPAQQAYLVSLGVRLEAGMTKGRASDLIEAAKSGMLSSIGGEEIEGPQSIGEIY